MAAFAIPYLAVWLAVALYVARFEYHRHRLARTIASLRSQQNSAESRSETVSKAA